MRDVGTCPDVTWVLTKNYNKKKKKKKGRRKKNGLLVKRQNDNTSPGHIAGENHPRILLTSIIVTNS